MLSKFYRWAFKNFGVDYYIVKNHLHIYGTNSPAEWLINLLAFPVKTSIGKVHLGFYLFALSIYGEIKPKLRPGFSFSGHSLGAGVVVQLAKMYHQKGLSAYAGILFGAPRSGDKSFAEDYPIPVIRHETSFDPVVHVPFRIMGFVHIGILEYHKIKFKGLKCFFRNHQPNVYQKFTEIRL